MSAELIQQALAEIKDKEAEEVTAKAQRLMRELQGEFSEADVLLRVSSKFIDAIRDNRAASQRGFFGKLFRGAVERRMEWYWDYMASDFITSEEEWVKRLSRDKQPVHHETGTRTQPFRQELVVIDGIALEIGWQAGIVESRQLHNPSVRTITTSNGSGTSYRFEYEGGQRILPSENTSRPIRIWRTIQGVTAGGTGVEKRGVTHDINRLSGELTTYAEDLQDDEVLGFSAGMFALGIMQSAIDHVQRQDG